MKHLKKALSLLVVLCLVLGTVGMSAVAASYPDTNGTRYEQAINLVSSLGIMTGFEDGTFRPDDNLTRAQYCTVLVRMLGMTDVLDSTSYVFFEDVLEDEWYAKPISLIFSLGLASGYGDGNFGPNDSVRYQDAVKMTVNALGYGFMAEENGGYPSGYMSVAQSLGMLKGISAVGTDPLSRGALAQLVYNSLNVELLKETYGTDGKGYEESDETLLERVFGATKAEGLVTANSTTALLGGKALNEGEVAIDGEVFKEGATNAGKHLGYYVTYYYVENDNGDLEIVSCELKPSSNKSLTIEADDVVRYTGNISETGGATLTYSTNGSKNTNVKLKNGIVVVYNGKRVASVTASGRANADYDLAALLPAYGSITLINNDANSDYDILTIEDVKTDQVTGINKGNKYIYAKQAGTIDLSQADDNKEFTYSIIRDGVEVPFDSLAIDTVLSVLKSKDGMNYTMYASTAQVAGEIQAINYKNGAKDVYDTVTIDGTKYKVVPDFPDTIELGKEGKFFLDYKGRIAAYATGTAGAVRYCYLMAADNQSTKLTTDVSIQVFTTGGTMAEYKLNEDVRFTGRLDGAWVKDYKIKAPELYEKALMVEDSGRTRVNDQLIVIDTDEENKVTKIAFASDIDADGDEYDDDLFSQDLTRYRYGIGLNTKGYNLPKSRDNVGNEGLLPDSTPVFYVTRVADYVKIDEERIRIVHRRDESIFSDSGDAATMDIKGYDMTTGGVLPVAVYTKTAKANDGATGANIGSYRIENGTKLLAVNEVVDSLDANGDPVTVIAGLSNGQNVEVAPAEKLNYAQDVEVVYRSFLEDRARAAGNPTKDAHELLAYLEPGDLLFYETNSDGEMSSYQPLIGRLVYATDADGNVDKTQLVRYTPDGNNVPNPNNAMPTLKQASAGSKEYARLVASKGPENYAETLVLFGQAYDKDVANNAFKYQSIWANKQNPIRNYINSNYAYGFAVVYDVEGKTFKAGSLADLVTYKQAGDYANWMLVEMEYAAPSWIVIYQ